MGQNSALVPSTLQHDEGRNVLSISNVREEFDSVIMQNWVGFKHCPGVQWWKSRRLVCTRVMPCSLQALITTSSAAEPAGAAMYATPLYRQTDRQTEEMLVRMVGKLSVEFLYAKLFQQVSAGHSHAISYLSAYSMNQCFCERCVVFTRFARSMLSLKGKKASELTATACRELIQFFFSVSDRGSGTSSYIDFQTAKSGPCTHKKYI